MLSKNYPDYGFIKGDTGIVVEKYEPISNNSKHGYIVEVIRDGITIGAEFIDIDDIDLVKKGYT